MEKNYFRTMFFSSLGLIYFIIDDREYLGGKLLATVKKSYRLAVRLIGIIGCSLALISDILCLSGVIDSELARNLYIIGLTPSTVCLMVIFVKWLKNGIKEFKDEMRDDSPLGISSKKYRKINAIIKKSKKKRNKSQRPYPSNVGEVS